MSKMRVLELLPFFALITIAAIVSSAMLASAGFAFPDLFGKWSIGDTASAYAPGTTTTVTKAYTPVMDVAVPAGFDSFNMPSFDGFNMFRSPVTSTQKYTRMVSTPDGPQTQVVEQSYDGMTGERVKTVTNL